MGWYGGLYLRWVGWAPAGLTNQCRPRGLTTEIRRGVVLPYPTHPGKGDAVLTSKMNVSAGEHELFVGDVQDDDPAAIAAQTMPDAVPPSPAELALVPTRPLPTPERPRITRMVARTWTVRQNSPVQVCPENPDRLSLTVLQWSTPAQESWLSTHGGASAVEMSFAFPSNVPIVLDGYTGELWLNTGDPVGNLVSVLEILR